MNDEQNIDFDLDADVDTNLNLDDEINQIASLTINPPSKTKVEKPPFVEKTGEEIRGLTKIEALEYKIELSKFQTQKLRDELRIQKKSGDRTSKTKETLRLILWGRLIEKCVGTNPDRQHIYDQLLKWLEQYLTKDNDRQAFGFSVLPEGESNDRN